MDPQCNGCGGFDHLDVCTHCSTVVCESCKQRHAPLCEGLKKRKKRGEGPTIRNAEPPPHRAGHESPPTTGPDRPFPLGTPATVFIPEWNPPVDAVDLGLQAVKSLLEESPNV